MPWRLVTTGCFRGWMPMRKQSFGKPLSKKAKYALVALAATAGASLIFGGGMLLGWRASPHSRRLPKGMLMATDDRIIWNEKEVVPSWDHDMAALSGVKSSLSFYPVPLVAGAGDLKRGYLVGRQPGALAVVCNDPHKYGERETFSCAPETGTLTRMDLPSSVPLPPVIAYQGKPCFWSGHDEQEKKNFYLENVAPVYAIESTHRENIRTYLDVIAGENSFCGMKMVPIVGDGTSEYCCPIGGQSWTLFSKNDGENISYALMTEPADSEGVGYKLTYWDNTLGYAFKTPVSPVEFSLWQKVPVSHAIIPSLAPTPVTAVGGEPGQVAPRPSPEVGRTLTYKLTHLGGIMLVKPADDVGIRLCDIKETATGRYGLFAQGETVNFILSTELGESGRAAYSLGYDTKELPIKYSRHEGSTLVVSPLYLARQNQKGFCLACKVNDEWHMVDRLLPDNILYCIPLGSSPAIVYAPDENTNSNFFG